MRLRARLFALLAALFAASALVAGPAVATEAEPTEPAATQPAEGAAGGEEGAEEGRTKIMPPLSFDDPQDLVGWGMLAIFGVLGALAVRNLFQQMRGERPKADGTWRPR